LPPEFLKYSIALHVALAQLKTQSYAWNLGISIFGRLSQRENYINGQKYYMGEYEESIAARTCNIAKLF
jgi:hypothetical protein